MSEAICIRPALLPDLAALCRVRYADQPGIHADRILASDGETSAYLVAVRGQDIIGFGVLQIEQPARWDDPHGQFPMVIDLFVDEDQRGQGYGRALLGAMEQLAAACGKAALHLSVEPLENPRALALYRSLGYAPLQDAPYHSEWRFTDSQGVEHSGEEWVIDMRKSLGNSSP